MDTFNNFPVLELIRRSSPANRTFSSEKRQHDECLLSPTALTRIPCWIAAMNSDHVRQTIAIVILVQVQGRVEVHRRASYGIVERPYQRTGSPIDRFHSLGQTRTVSMDGSTRVTYTSASTGDAIRNSIAVDVALTIQSKDFVIRFVIAPQHLPVSAVQCLASRRTAVIEFPLRNFALPSHLHCTEKSH